MKFLIIFVIIFMSFLISMSIIYTYYNSTNRTKVELNSHYASPTNGEDNFGS